MLIGDSIAPDNGAIGRRKATREQGRQSDNRPLHIVDKPPDFRVVNRHLSKKRKRALISLRIVEGGFCFFSCWRITLFAKVEIPHPGFFIAGDKCFRVLFTESRYVVRVSGFEASEQARPTAPNWHG